MYSLVEFALSSQLNLAQKSTENLSVFKYIYFHKQNNKYF